jgi:uncharacterized protein YndB with AHSA1/START domain
MQNTSQNTLPDIRKTIVLNAPLDKVWTAVSTAEAIGAWFMPNTFQPILGHNFILRAGEYGDSKCTVTELDPPNRLAFTWGEKDWVVSFDLADVDGKTEFKLIHSGWTADDVTEFGEMHSIVRERMDGGWTFIVERLQKLVEA